MRLELQVEGRESPRPVVHALFSSAIRIVTDCLRNHLILTEYHRAEKSEKLITYLYIK